MSSNNNLHKEPNFDKPMPDAVENRLTVSAENHKHLMMSGKKWIGMGVLLMGTSFGLNYLLFHAGVSFTLFMYILTTLGTVAIMKGLANIVGF